jgi:chromate transporter
MEEENATAHEPKGSLMEVAREFLRLGFIAYGGPAAHVAMMEEDFVRRREWVTRQRFLDLLGAVSLLPGPSSTELAIYLGEIRAGWAGLIVAGACFILPAAVLAAGLAWAYSRYGTAPQVSGLLFGIKPVVVALVVQAVWNLAKTALRSLPQGLLALTVIVCAAFGMHALGLLLGAGCLCAVVREGKRLMSSRNALRLMVPIGTSSAGMAIGTLSVFFYFLKVGAVLVGSGYVLLPVLRADLVSKLHWLTDAQLLDAVAVSQATPGPFFTVATFIGFVLAGWKGAALATCGMFLPAFIYVGLTSRYLPQLRKLPLAGAFLDGVNAAAVALMSFVGWQFARAALLSVPAIVIGTVSAVFVFRYKINTAWLVLGGAVAGFALRWLGWS